MREMARTVPHAQTSVRNSYRFFKENMPENVTEDVFKDSVTKPCKFTELYHTMPSKISKQMAKNLSVPIAFVCLLHLANEKVL
jgi:condensin complex subunit 2